MNFLKKLFQRKKVCQPVGRMKLSKEPLSSSINGGGIKLYTTVVHDPVELDELWLYAMNTGIDEVKVTLLFGLTESGGSIKEIHVPATGTLMLIVPGLPLKPGQTVRAFTDKEDTVMLHGFVNRAIRED